MHTQMGLDKPLIIQYLTYMNNVLHGNLGNSIYFVKPNAQLIAERFPATIQLTFSTIAVSLIVADSAGCSGRGVKKGTAARLFFNAVRIVWAVYVQCVARHPSDTYLCRKTQASSGNGIRQLARI